MAKHTPTTEEVREAYVRGHFASPQRTVTAAEFDRWLANIKEEDYGSTVKHD